jgi:transcriptional regulator with XRE-family HTH domain
MTGGELREARERLGWTRERLAEYLGYSVRYLAECERGRFPIVERLERQVRIFILAYLLCKELGILSNGQAGELPLP